MAKTQLFSKMTKKDYNNILEKVLEKKDFTSNVKSLLLSMLYKIENSYNDYKTAKVLVQNKETFIKQVIEVIQNKVNKIILIEPNSEIGYELKEQGKTAVVKKDVIFAYPTENALIAGISNLIIKNYNVKSEYQFVNEELNKILQSGYVRGIQEVIYDFDGWSWNPLVRSKEESLYNLLYFNILVLLGFDFMEEWRLSSDESQNFIDRAEVKLMLYYGKKSKLITMSKMYNILIKIATKNSEEKILNLIKMGESKKKSLDYIVNRFQYLEYIYNEKRKISKEIKELDTILLDRERLYEEYKKRNLNLSLNSQIFSKRHLADVLREEREELFEKLKNYNEKLEPESYIKEKEEIENEYKKYVYIEKIYNSSVTIEDLIISFQKIFLENLRKKVLKFDNKKDIIDLIFIIRYYKNIKIDESKYVKDIIEIQEEIIKLEELILKSAYKYDVFVRITQNQEKSIEILSNILDTKIIDLREIKLLSKVLSRKLLLEVYDGDVLDTTLEIAKNVKQGPSNKNRKINLFL